MAKYLLIGLCEPPDADAQAAFDEWFVGQHIEDTARCPGFIRSSIYQLAGPHLDGETVSRYLSLYEVEAASYAEAERLINDWQADPDAWAGRRLHWDTARKLGSVPLTVKGSGWYELMAEYDGAGSLVEQPGTNGG